MCRPSNIDGRCEIRLLYLLKILILYIAVCELRRGFALQCFHSIVTDHPSLSIAKIMKKHLSVLHTSNRLKQAIPYPPLVVFRRPKNLSDLLVQMKLETPAPSPPPTNTGNIPCGHRRCKCCYEIVTTSSFRSYSTGRRYNIRANITCKSRNLVYLISCKRYGYSMLEKRKIPCISK